MAGLRKLTLAEKLGIKEGYNVTVVGLCNKNDGLDFGVYTTYEQLPRIVLLRMLNISRKLMQNLPEPERRDIIANALSSLIGESFGSIQGHHIPGVQWSFGRPRGLQDIVLYFVRARTELAAELPTLKSWLAEKGTIWIAWPKQACEIVTDLEHKIVYKLATKSGLISVKGCSIDKQWFAVKFILASTDRSASRIERNPGNQ